MTNRERTLAILNYDKYDRLPLVHFGYWEETLEKWYMEGHVNKGEIAGLLDGDDKDSALGQKIGFDYNWQNLVGTTCPLLPLFEEQVIEELPDGFRKVLTSYGAVVLKRDGANSIPAEVDHILKGRKEWEEQYVPRLQFSAGRIPKEKIAALKSDKNRENPIGLNCGSLFGEIRNWMGIVGISYLYADDEELYSEIIDTVANLSYKTIEETLKTGAKFDYAHFWEDICFKNGPLVAPAIFEEKVGPHYKRITDLVKSYGINIISLDCDGWIDALIPIWLKNGVNTMFPIEVGTWGADIKPWREKYGKEIRGVGGMNKIVFAYDYAAVDAEIERLKPLVELGGFIPCPDHRIPPDAKWENVQYYCDRMRRIFG